VDLLIVRAMTLLGGRLPRRPAAADAIGERQPKRPAPSAFGLGMLVWGLLLMNVGLLISLQSWLEGSSPSVPMVLAVAPLAVGLVIVGRAVRVFRGGVGADGQANDRPRS
jgi:hypothetical protein